jgi:hypothetical protein
MGEQDNPYNLFKGNELQQAYADNPYMQKPQPVQWSSGGLGQQQPPAQQPDPTAASQSNALQSQQSSAQLQQALSQMGGKGGGGSILQDIGSIVGLVAALA